MRRALERLAVASLRAASRRTIVPHRGRVRLPGLAAPVVVRFDGHGVPHVRAQTDADAFLAHGFCHALDRFFQMDMLRRVFAGRLAETVGERRLGVRGLAPFGPRSTTLDVDRLVRSLDVPGAARRTLAAGRSEDRALLDAYVQGVNEAVALLRRRRPLEHRLLRLPLEPWRAVDSVRVAKGMALGLSYKWRTGPVLAAIAERLAEQPSLLGSVLPPVPAAGDPALAEVVWRGVEQAVSFLPAPVAPRGSNALLVGGGRTRSGRPLLANDPHLEFSLPSIWYLASLHAPRYRAVGCSLPGLPGVVIGRTPSVAWALTNGMIDDGDLWVEEIDGTGTRYRVDGAWRPLRIETQEIRRRGAPPVLLRLRRTHRGPIVTDAYPTYDGPPLSLRLTLHEPAGDLQSFLGFGRGRTAADAREAAVGHGAPAENLLYADTAGTAGYVLMGRVPLRAPHPVHPGLPRDGTDARTDWTGFADRAELPAFELSADDAIASANDAHLAGTRPHYLSHLYEPPYRALRLRELLRDRDGLTVGDLARMQLDDHNGAAGWFRRLVLEPHAEAVRRLQPSLGRLLDRLLAWDGHERAEAGAVGLWHLTYHHLLRRTFGASLGEELLRAWLGLINLVDAPLRRAFEDPESPWAPPATRPSLLARALEDAARDLAARGLHAESPWGALHTVTLRHPLSILPGVGAAFTRGPLPLPGGPYAPCAGQYVHSHPAEVVAGASYRQVVDLGDPEGQSSMVTFGGQSGAIASPHYDDMTPRWLAGEGLPMRLEDVPPAGTALLLE